MRNLAQTVTCLCPSVEELSSFAPLLGENTARSEVVSRTVNRELDTVLRQHKDSKLRLAMVENMLRGGQSNCRLKSPGVLGGGWGSTGGVWCVARATTRYNVGLHG